MELYSQLLSSCLNDEVLRIDRKSLDSHVDQILAHLKTQLDKVENFDLEKLLVSIEIPYSQKIASDERLFSVYEWMADHGNMKVKPEVKAFRPFLVGQHYAKSSERSSQLKAIKRYEESCRLSELLPYFSESQARQRIQVVRAYQEIDPDNSKLADHMVLLLKAVNDSPDAVFNGLTVMDPDLVSLIVLDRLASAQCLKAKGKSQLQEALFTLRKRRFYRTPEFAAGRAAIDITKTTALNQLAQSVVDTHRLGMVDELVSQAATLRRLKVVPPDLAIANLYKLASDIYRVKGDDERSFSCAELAYKYTKGSKTIDAQVVTGIALTEAYYFAGKTEKALLLARPIAKQAVVLLQTARGDTHELARASQFNRLALWSLFRIYVKNRDYEKAQEQIEELARLERLMHSSIPMEPRWTEGSVAFQAKDWKRLDAVIRKDEQFSKSHLVKEYTIGK